MKKNKRSILKSSKKFIKTPAKSRQHSASEVEIWNLWALLYDFSSAKNKI